MAKRKLKKSGLVSGLIAGAASLIPGGSALVEGLKAAKEQKDINKIDAAKSINGIFNRKEKEEKNDFTITTDFLIYGIIGFLIYSMFNKY